MGVITRKFLSSNKLRESRVKQVPFFVFNVGFVRACNTYTRREKSKLFFKQGIIYMGKVNIKIKKLLNPWFNLLLTNVSLKATEFINYV